MIAHRHDHSVDLKRRPPKSLPWPHLFRKKPKPSPSEEAARKDSAVHVSLSSDSLVKHPGACRLRLRSLRSRRSPHIRHGHGAGRMIHRINSEGLRGRAIAPRRRRFQRPYIGFGSRHCQPARESKYVLWIDDAGATVALQCTRKPKGRQHVDPGQSGFKSSL